MGDAAQAFRPFTPPPSCPPPQPGGGRLRKGKRRKRVWKPCPELKSAQLRIRLLKLVTSDPPTQTASTELGLILPHFKKKEKEKNNNNNTKKSLTGQELKGFRKKIPRYFWEMPKLPCPVPQKSWRLFQERKNENEPQLCAGHPRPPWAVPWGPPLPPHSPVSVEASNRGTFKILQVTCCTLSLARLPAETQN